MAEYEIRSLHGPMGKVWWNAGNEIWRFSVTDEDMRATLEAVATQGYVEGRESIQTSEFIADALVSVPVPDERFIGALSDYLMGGDEGVMGLYRNEQRP